MECSKKPCFYNAIETRPRGPRGFNGNIKSQKYRITIAALVQIYAENKFIVAQNEEKCLVPL